MEEKSNPTEIDSGMKRKALFFNLLYVLLILGVLAFMIWMVFWLKGDGFSCVNDPISFIAEKIPEKEMGFDLCMQTHCYSCQLKMNNFNP